MSDFARYRKHGIMSSNLTTYFKGCVAKHPHLKHYPPSQTLNVFRQDLSHISLGSYHTVEIGALRMMKDALEEGAILVHVQDNVSSHIVFTTC